MQVRTKLNEPRKITLTATELRKLADAASILKDLGEIAPDQRAHDAAAIVADVIAHYEKD